MSNMKKGLMIFMAVVLAACSTLTPAEKAERQAKRAQAVEKALAERHYKVDVEMMYPRRGKAVNVSSNYSLEVKGDTLISYLGHTCHFNKIKFISEEFERVGLEYNY